MKAIYILGMGALASISHAVVLLSENFDNLTDGTIVGQQSTTGALAPATWSRFGDTGNPNTIGAASVSILAANGAGKGLRLSSAFNASGGAITRPAFSDYQLEIGESVSVYADFKCAPAASSSTNLQFFSGLGIGRTATDFAGAYFSNRPGSTSDLTHGNIFITRRTDEGVLVEAACTVDANTAFLYNLNSWYQLSITQTRINATDSLLRYYLNGVQLKTYESNPGGNELRDAELLLSGVTLARRPMIYDAGLGTFRTVSVDNFRVEAVPEPATMAALALGFAAIAKRRRIS